MKEVIKIFTVYTIIFVFLINFDIIEIFVYNGIVSMIFSFFITFLIFFKKKYSLLISVLVVSISIHFSLFLFVPVTIDRSISVNLLIELNENYKNEYLSKQEISRIINDYTSSSEFVEKRINEQVASKNIVKTPRGYIFTRSGENLIKLFNIINKIYDF